MGKKLGAVSFLQILAPELNDRMLADFMEAQDGLMVNFADTKQKLENNIFQSAGVAQKYNCPLIRLDYRQEQGLMSSLPLGLNLIQIQRGLTTSSTAVLCSLHGQELFQSGEALYYGLNALSNNMILADRKKLKNPNDLILGTPGSVKSVSRQSVKLQMRSLCKSDDIIICDPEAEYFPLVQRLHGQVIKLSPRARTARKTAVHQSDGYEPQLFRGRQPPSLKE